MHVFVVIMIIAILTATVYTIVINMMVDAYRYEKAVERANEKVRLAAVIGSSGFYYGIRNIGLSDLVIKEAGVIDSSGNRQVLITNTKLGPGEAIINNQQNPGSYITFYVVTGRNNVFSTRVISLLDRGASTIPIRNLVPGVALIPSPVQYSEAYVPSISVAMYSYFFAYLIVKDPYSDESIYLTIGPVSISDLFKKISLPYRVSKVEKWTSKLYASISAVLTLNDQDSENSVPYYKLVVPVRFERTDNKNGLIAQGCLGFIWRTETSNMFGFWLLPKANWGTAQSTPQFRVETNYFARLIPSSLSIDTLMPTLISLLPATWYSVGAPSGSQAYVVLAKCFKIEDATLKKVETTEDKPWAQVHGVRIYTYVVFPGRTYVDQNYYGDVYSLDLYVELNPEVYVKTALSYI